MINLNNGKGSIVTTTCIFVIVIIIILVPTFSSVAFLCRNWARTDSLRQQASYNANSGVEYARFIIEHSTVYDPLSSVGATGKTAWPKGTNFDSPNNGASFQCFDDSEQGTATISIATDGTGGYDISSAGMLGTITTTTEAHYVGGKIEGWG